MVNVREPAIECVYCSGSGKQISDVRLTCPVCFGKGAVTVSENKKKCPQCRGIGKVKESKLPCLICGGKGVIEK
jgi:DnaJ-class molecular chaperone